MPRSIEVSAPPEKIDAVLERVREIDGVVGLARQRGASLIPPGDVLSIQVTTDATRPVLAVFNELDVGESGSVRTSESTSLVSPAQQSVIDEESNETVWDEMAFLLRKDTNLSFNYLAAMALAGAIAAGGLWLDKLHLIVGAMVIAPAFEPLVRLPFGIISGARQLVPSGLASAAAGYLILALGGLLTTLVLGLWAPGPTEPLAKQQWVGYWSTLSLSSALISTFGGLAGAIVICGRRSVLTTGVMITLALIPSMAVVGMGIAVGDFSLAGKGFLRWLVDVMLVTVMSAIVFGVKRKFLHHGGRALS